MAGTSWLGSAISSRDDSRVCVWGAGGLQNRPVGFDSSHPCLAKSECRRRHGISTTGDSQWTRYVSYENRRARDESTTSMTRTSWCSSNASPRSCGPDCDRFTSRTEHGAIASWATSLAVDATSPYVLFPNTSASADCVATMDCRHERSALHNAANGRSRPYDACCCMTSSSTNWATSRSSTSMRTAREDASRVRQRQRNSPTGGDDACGQNRSITPTRSTTRRHPKNWNC